MSNRLMAMWLVPVTLVGVAAWTLGWRGGSIDASDWLPFAIGATLLLATLLLSGRSPRPSAAASAGALALMALAGWMALSIMWSPSPELARNEALLTAFYAAVFLVPVLTLVTFEAALAATVVVTAVTIAFALGTSISLAWGDHVTDGFEGGRLGTPIGYANAEAAMVLIGFWPAIALAARRTLPIALRALALGGAVALGGVWLLVQSKGGAIGIVLSGVVFFGLERGRVRALVPFVVSAVFFVAAFDRLTKPFRVRSQPNFGTAIHAAGATVLILSAAAVVVGALYAFLDQRIVIGRRAAGAAGAIAAVVLAAAVGVGVTAFFTRVERPQAFVEARWQSFKRLPRRETGASHLTNLGSNRYDFWRVALEEFERHPIGGVGARGWANAYLIEGRSDETPERSHSVELDALSETGVVGFALLVVAVLAPLAAIAHRASRGIAAPGVLGAATYWLVHASGDWLWTIPAVALPFFLFLGIGVAGRPRGDEHESRLLPVVAIPLGLASLALALLALTPPWLSSRYTDRAAEGLPSAPSDLRRAEQLDPLAVEPLIVESALAATPAAAVAPLERSVERQPRSSDLQYLLGVAELRAGRPIAARRSLLRAERLAPRDQLVALALHQLKSRR